MIILQTGFFEPRDKFGRLSGQPKKLLVSCAFDADTMRAVPIQNLPPEQIEGSRYDQQLQEWVIDETTDN